MILRRVGNECIYMDEKAASEFERVFTVCIGLGSIMALIALVLPLLVMSGIDRALSAAIIVVLITIEVIFTIYNMATPPRKYYDVWISGEHIQVDKTGSARDAILVQSAADTLELVLKERSRFADSLRYH